jgi:hypothetical protein
VLTRVDAPDDGVADESLIVSFSLSSSVMVYDYFGAVQDGITPTAAADCVNGTNDTKVNGCTVSHSGTIEQLVFADQTLSLEQVIRETTPETPVTTLQTLDAGAGGSTSTAKTSSKSSATVAGDLLSNAPDFDAKPRMLDMPRR